MDLSTWVLAIPFFLLIIPAGIILFAVFYHGWKLIRAVYREIMAVIRL